MVVRLTEPRVFPAGEIPAWLPQITTGALRYRLRSTEWAATVAVRPPNWTARRYGAAGTAQRVMVCAEHVLAWEGVADPPWSAIDAALGHVNDAPFLGRGPSVLLCVAAEVLPTFDPVAPTSRAVRWRCEYVFRQRAGGEAWYYEYSDDGGAWEMCYDLNSSFLYASSGFGALFVEGA